MFKSKLQELCHSNKWALPAYKLVKHGVDHNPYFKATVTIGNTSFESPHHLPCWSSKEDQNMAAQVALTHIEEIATTRKGRDRPTNYSDTSDDSDGSVSKRRLKKDMTFWRRSCGTSSRHHTSSRRSVCSTPVQGLTQEESDKLLRDVNRLNLDPETCARILSDLCDPVKRQLFYACPLKEEYVS
ncbi:hypothetical protein AgCh_015787 [Apium graveolens]